MRTRRLPSSSDPVPEPMHRTVLLHEAIEALDLVSNDVVLDATLGAGGHARLIAQSLGTEGILVGLDADNAAIQRARSALKGASPRIELIESNFRHIRNIQASLHVVITKALFDLGWSSYQLSNGKGFSFQKDEPLMMTYGDTALTAGEIINTWSETSLADIFYGWGEERFSRRIARAIVEHRSKKEFTTSKEFADFIATVIPKRSKIHPATRVFQALRIAVNDELGALTDALATLIQTMPVGGRIAIISFHSIEDRLVKRTFEEWVMRGLAARVTKKPITPSAQELSENPRSRSAKLRVVQKIST